LRESLAFGLSCLLSGFENSHQPRGICLLFVGLGSPFFHAIKAISMPA
jgi:hypothetical protein